jgi:hypothetical protein
VTTRKLVLSIIIGVLVITGIVVILQYEQKVRSKNEVTYANPNQIQELKMKINQLRHSSKWEIGTNQ